MRMLRIKAVAEKTGLASSTLYEWMRKGAFPRPVSLGSASRWPEHQIDAWLLARIAEHENPAPPPKPTLSAGRAKFWEDVREGIRPHPRVAGRLRREAGAKP